jgi:uncharacterized protein YjbJ (UPF0337 family)
MNFQRLALEIGAWNVLSEGALSMHPRNRRNGTMDREHIKGAADKAKGAVKETAGKLTGDKKLETDGKVDKAKGDLHNVAGDVKDAVRNVSKAANR